MVKWDEHLTLFTPDEFNQIPDGVEFVSIGGSKVTKGQGEIDMDTRFGHIAYGVMHVESHPESELFAKIKLMQ